MSSCKYSNPSTFPVQQLDRLCVYNHGAYDIRYYQLYQNSDCQYNFYSSASSQCFNLQSITNGNCFQPGSTFQLWVNAEVATCAYSYVVNSIFQFMPNASWVSVTLTGTVDNIQSSITAGADLPTVQVSSITGCNQGGFGVNSFYIWFVYI